MFFRLLAAAIVICLETAAFAQAAPPVAAKRPFAIKAPFGAVRTDDYYWLRDDSRKNPEMLAHLAAENTYTDAVMAPTKALQAKIYTEITGRIKQDDSSVPYRLRGYWYYTRFDTGQNYPINARRRDSMTGAEQVLLDQPAMGASKGNFQVGDTEVSPDNRLLAWADDTVGRRQYIIRVKDIATGKVLADAIPNAEPNIIWADDNRTIYYVEKDPVTLLSKRVKAHVLGTPNSTDRLIYEEKDDTFYMGIGRTRSDKYICIGVESTVSSETRCTSAASPGTFAVIAPRQRDFLYNAEHLDGRWVIRTNWNARNFKLMQVADSAVSGSRDAWTDLVPHDPTVFLEGFDLFDTFLAIEERSGGLKRLRTLRGADSSFVAADEPAYAMALSVNSEPGTPLLR